MSSNFKAFVVREDGDGLFSNAIENRLLILQSIIKMHCPLREIRE